MIGAMPTRPCHHCKETIEDGAAHDCWTTSERALVSDLSEDLLEAWERLRETAAGFGDQRIYSSGHAIMFARTTAYCFVRPKRRFLELCVFLGRALHAPQVRKVAPASRVKVAHIIHIRHRDEVEAPVTTWMREAYDDNDRLSQKSAGAKSAIRRQAGAHLRGR